MTGANDEQIGGTFKEFFRFFNDPVHVAVAVTFALLALLSSINITSITSRLLPGYRPGRLSTVFADCC